VSRGLKKRVGLLYGLFALLELLACLYGPFAISGGKPAVSDLFYLLILIAHFMGAGLFLRADRLGRRQRRFLLLRLPELLLFVVLVFFLFSYIYALNANMDYVQRFIAGGGAVRLALSTVRERLHSAFRFLPLILLNGFFYVSGRLPRYPGLRSRGPLAAISRWALPLVLASSFLGAVCFPSFACQEGLAPLAYIAPVPLFLLFEAVSYRRGLFYGAGFGVLQGMLVNYWLGTFSLISLQLVSFFFLFAYTLFLIPSLWAYRRLGAPRFLVLPLAWVFFEYLRSLGFLGYPWGLWGASQYRFLPLIQIASLTGVWGVSLVVLLAASGIAGSLARRLRGEATAWLPLACGLAVVALAAGWGQARLARLARAPQGERVRVALVQQNSDPRKNDYRDTYAALVELTDRAMAAKPELVAWSETAFVPNIRHWSRMDPREHELAALVREFLDYQKSLGTWLLTGNDDYEIAFGADGREERLDYNGALLFSPAGEWVATYHKIRLVPFTEHFPWRRSLPALARVLESFDVYLWEPGSQRVVFRHPRFSFATPICFEDVFPAEIRAFVLLGAELILNLSNDYWSLTEVEARQHFMHAVFRAVENRRPLLRAAASGLTCSVDPAGRLLEALPCYQEGFLVIEVALPGEERTLYTRWGDWFPLLTGGLFGLLCLLGLLRQAGGAETRRPGVGGPRGPGVGGAETRRPGVYWPESKTVFPTSKRARSIPSR